MVKNAELKMFHAEISLLDSHLLKKKGKLLIAQLNETIENSKVDVPFRRIRQSETHNDNGSVCMYVGVRVCSCVRIYLNDIVSSKNTVRASMLEK